MTLPLELFDYQEAILGKLRAGFIDGHRVQMLVAPTGAGKTEMAMELLEATATKGNRAAMLLDRIVLCNQTSERLDKYGIGHGVRQSGHWRFRPQELIQVCSAQTLEKQGSFPNLKLLIVDEAHQTRKQTILFIRNNPHVKVVGLSATPFTKGLGKTYTNVVSAVTTAELVERKRLVPLQVFVAKEIDMTGAKKVAGEWSGKDAEDRGMAITGDIVAEWAKKTHEVFGGPVKTVVFASGVAHAADLAQKFAAAGYNFLPLSYKDDDDYKADAIKDFAKPDTEIHGLIATDILTKGFDVPDVKIGISARPFSKSLSSHIQQMGRVMRCSPGKEFALWLDHSGNYVRFQKDWDDVFYNGITSIDEGREKPKKEPTEREKQEAKCPRCSRVWPAHAETCPSCGFVRLKRNEVITVPGELTKLEGGKAGVSKEAKQQWYSMLLYIQREPRPKPYKESWVISKYKEKFGVWPRDLDFERMLPPSKEVKAWVQSRNIAWAKSMAKGGQAA